MAFVADGNHSEAVQISLRDFEAQAKTERAAIKAIKELGTRPVVLPTPDQVLARAQDLEFVLRGDPTRAREALRRALKGGRITMHPQPDGSYIAEMTLLPLVMLGHTAPAMGATTPDVVAPAIGEVGIKLLLPIGKCKP